MPDGARHGGSDFLGAANRAAAPSKLSVDAALSIMFQIIQTTELAGIMTVISE